MKAKFSMSNEPSPHTVVQLQIRMPLAMRDQLRMEAIRVRKSMNDLARDMIERGLVALTNDRRKAGALPRWRKSDENSAASLLDDQGRLKSKPGGKR